MTKLDLQTSPAPDSSPPKPRAYWNPRLATSFYLAAGRTVFFVTLVLHRGLGSGAPSNL